MLIEGWQIKREDQIPRQLVDYIMAKSYEQHGFRELSGADEDEADIGDPNSVSIDTNSYCRSTPLEIPERSSCPQDIAYSTIEAQIYQAAILP